MKIRTPLQLRLDRTAAAFVRRWHIHIGGSLNATASLLLAELNALLDSITDVQTVRNRLDALTALNSSRRRSAHHHPSKTTKHGSLP